MPCILNFERSKSAQPPNVYWQIFLVEIIFECNHYDPHDGFANDQKCLADMYAFEACFGGLHLAFNPCGHSVY